MMKKLALCAAMAGVIAIPMDAIGQPEPAAETAVDPGNPDPSTPKDVTDSVSGLIDATRTGSWIAIVGGVIALLLNLFRLPLLGSLTKKIPGRWRLVIAVVLGGVGGILTGIAGGLPWYEAVAVGLFSGPSAVFAHEAVLNTIMGVREKKKTEANKPA